MVIPRRYLRKGNEHMRKSLSFLVVLVATLLMTSCNTTTHRAFSGDLPQLLGVAEEGNRLIFEIGNPFYTYVTCRVVDSIIPYTFTTPGVHQIVVEKLSGDYVKCYTTTNIYDSRICGSKWHRIKLYTPDNVIREDGVYVFGEYYKIGETPIVTDYLCIHLDTHKDEADKIIETLRTE